MEFVALEVVPVAVEADLDDVAGELLVGGVEALELGRRGDAAAVGPSQGVAVPGDSGQDAVWFTFDGGLTWQRSAITNG